MRISIISAIAIAIIATSARAETLVTFNDHALPANTFDNGGPVTNSDGFVSSNTFFNNRYNSDFGGYWSGFSLSSVADATTAGFGNQYASFAGSGFGGSGTYAIAYPRAFINLALGESPVSVKLSNTTYAAFSMRDGDAFAKKFGGPTGNDPDRFAVKLTGYAGLNGTGVDTGSTTLVLADYTFTDNASDYILGSWANLDLTGLGAARSIAISFESTDVGAFGINTPVYVALDNLVTVPEPSALALLALAALARRRR